MNTFTVNTGGLLHVSNNVFSARHSKTHVLYAVSKGGQIIHDDLNRCATTGIFTVNTQADGPPHILRIKGYTALAAVAISHTPTATMDGLSIELTAGQATKVVVDTGLSTNANVLITDFASTGAMNVGWSTCTNCSVTFVNPASSSMALSGTALTGSNVTVVGGTVVLNVLVSAAASASTVLLQGTSIRGYVSIAGSLVGSSVLLNSTTISNGGSSSALIVTSTFAASLLHVDNCSLTSSFYHVVQMSSTFATAPWAPSP